MPYSGGEVAGGAWWSWQGDEGQPNSGVAERVRLEGPHVDARDLTDDCRTKDDRTRERSKKEPNFLFR